MQHVGVEWRCLTLAGSLGLAACGSDTPPPVGVWLPEYETAAARRQPAPAPGSFCDVFVRRAQQCGVVQGDYRACVNYDDELERCEAQCLQRAPCDYFVRSLCVTDGAEPVRRPDFRRGELTELQRCYDACREVEPWTCPDGRVFSGYARCDFIDHCSSGPGEVSADEADCVSCADGTLLADGEQCTELNACGSRSCPECDAEGQCVAAPPAVPMVRYPCRDGSTFTRQDRVCDGVVDCPDGSDEIDCVVYGRCGSRLITPWEYCDGIADCGGESPADEPAECSDVRVALCSCFALSAPAGDAGSPDAGEAQVPNCFDP